MKRAFCVCLSLLLITCIAACDTDLSAPVDTINNIKSLSFSSSGDIKLQVGKEESGGNVRVSVRDRDEFIPANVEFISEDNNIATIEYVRDALTVYLYYKITAIGGGETYVYAIAKDGGAVSEKIKVIVEGEPYSDTMEAVPYTTEPLITKKSETTSPPSTETKPEAIAPETTVAPQTTVAPESVLKLVSVTSPCENGSNATVAIIGKPNTEYKIGVFYSTKASEAQGLEKKTSDDSGNVSWTWKVGANTAAGEHEIKISGGGEEVKTTFTTYKG